MPPGERGRWDVKILLLACAMLLVCGATCRSSSRDCGPIALHEICKQLGVDARVEELSALAAATDQGTNLLGLAEAAKLKGLATVCMKMSIEELKRTDTPAIAYLWKNHFVAVTSSTFDPTDYSGFVMFVSTDRDKLPRPVETRTPDLRVSDYVWYFGTAVQGRKARHTFTLRNVGAERLTISQIAPTASSVSVENDAAQGDPGLSPGTSADLVVTFDSTGKEGVQEEQIVICSNDPVSPVVKLTVTGYVAPPVLIFPTRTVTFGRIRMGQEAKVRIPLAARITKVASTMPEVSAVQDERGLVLSLAAGLPVGEHTGQLTFETEDYPPKTVPVRATIVGTIDLRPDMLFFGTGKEARISVSSSDDFSIESPLSFLTISRKGRTIVATLKKDTPPGSYSGSVWLCHHGERIEIPVHAFREK